jgi:hypothetical protein
MNEQDFEFSLNVWTDVIKNDIIREIIRGCCKYKASERLDIKSIFRKYYYQYMYLSNLDSY